MRSGYYVQIGYKAYKATGLQRGSAQDSTCVIPGPKFNTSGLRYRLIDSDPNLFSKKAPLPCKDLHSLGRSRYGKKVGRNAASYLSGFVSTGALNMTRTVVQKQ